MALAPLTFLNGAQLTTAQDQVELIYVGYFGRAGDPSGVQSWINDLNAGGDIEGVALNFAKSPEAQALYPFLAFPSLDSEAFREAFVTEIYDNLFNRAPDAAGLSYWENELALYQTDFNNGIGGVDAEGNVLDAADFFAYRVGNFILTVALGAQNTADGQDITTLLNKTDVAGYFTDAIADAGIAWDGINPPEITLEAKAVVDNTNDLPGSVENQEAIIDQFIVDFLSNVTVDYTLVTPETLVAPDPNVDTTFRGVVDDNGIIDDSTIQPFDQAIGGENAFNTIQALVLEEDGDVFLNGTNINRIQVTDLDGATFILNGPFVPGGLTGLEQISSVNSDDGSTFEGVQDVVTTVDIVNPTGAGETLNINLAGGVHTPGDDLEVDVNLTNTDDWELDYDNSTGGNADDIVTVYNLHVTGVNNEFALDDLDLLTTLNIDGTGSLDVDNLDGQDTPSLAAVNAGDLEGDLNFDDDFIVQVASFEFNGAQGSNGAGFDLTLDAQTLTVNSQDGADTFDIDVDGFASSLTVNTAGGDDVVDIFDAGAATSVNVNLGAGSDFLDLNQLGTGFILNGGADLGDTVEVEANDIDTNSNGFETNTFLGWETVIMNGTANSAIDFSAATTLPGVTSFVFDDNQGAQNITIRDIPDGSTIVFDDGYTDSNNGLTFDLLGTDGTLNWIINGSAFDTDDVTLTDVSTWSISSNSQDIFITTIGGEDFIAPNLQTITGVNLDPTSSMTFQFNFSGASDNASALTVVDLAGMDNTSFGLVVDPDSPPVTITLGDFIDDSFVTLESANADTDFIVLTGYQDPGAGAQTIDLDISNFEAAPGLNNDVLDLSAFNLIPANLTITGEGVLFGNITVSFLQGADTIEVNLLGAGQLFQTEADILAFNIIL